MAAEKHDYPYVTWPEHTELSERMAIVETVVREKIPMIEQQLREAKEVTHQTHDLVVDHVAKEDAWQAKLDMKLDAFGKVIDAKFEALTKASNSIKKSTVERWFWKGIGAMCSVPFSLYYLIKFLQSLGSH